MVHIFYLKLSNIKIILMLNKNCKKLLFFTLMLLMNLSIQNIKMKILKFGKISAPVNNNYKFCIFINFNSDFENVLI